MNPIPEDEFDRDYQPFMQTNGDYFEFEDVEKAPINTVWTIIEGDDGSMFASPGFHIVNKIGYIRTVKPWTDAARDAVWFDAADMN